MRTDEHMVKIPERQQDVTRGVLAVLFIVALIGSSLWILRPFLAAIVWAGTIVIATWPLMLNLQRMNAKKYLYEVYSERVASMRLLPFDPSWDGATNFVTK